MSSRESCPIALYGQLREIRHNAVGWRLLKAAMFPRHVRRHTVWLWLATCMHLPFILSPLILPPEAYGWTLTGSITWTVFGYFPIASHAIRTAFTKEHGRYHIKGHPVMIRQILLQYALFRERLEDAKLSYTADDIERCIAFHKTLAGPLGIGNFMSLPVVTLFIGAWLAAGAELLTDQLKALPQGMASYGGLTLMLLSSLAIVYVLVSAPKDSHWQLERCLTWLKLECEGLGCADLPSAVKTPTAVQV